MGWPHRMCPRVVRWISRTWWRSEPMLLSVVLHNGQGSRSSTGPSVLLVAPVGVDLGGQQGGVDAVHDGLVHTLDLEPLDGPQAVQGHGGRSTALGDPDMAEHHVHGLEVPAEGTGLPGQLRIHATSDLLRANPPQPYAG